MSPLFTTTECDLTVIGGGPSGLTAAVFAASEGLKVTIIEADRQTGGQASHSSRIVNYPGFPEGTTGRALTDKFAEQAVKLGARIVYGRVAHIGLEGSTKVVQFDDGRVLTCKSVLVTTGVSYRKLTASGSDTFGVFYGLNPEMLPTWNGADVAVVGGANSAGQAIVALAGVARRVQVLARSPLAKSMSEYLVREIAELPNVEVIEGVEIASVTTGTSKVLDVELTNGERRENDAVFVFIGAAPRTEWLPVVKDTAGFVLTGRDLQDVSPTLQPAALETSIPGVFAAGDVRRGSVKRVVSASGEGAAAVAEIHQYLGGL